MRAISSCSHSAVICRALDSLFNTLKKHGSSFPVEFWDTVCQELLFPIFAVLKSSQDLSRFSTQEDMSVWLSTTMIQALRDLIDLYTFYFDILERFLDGLLDLLCVCICQGMLFGRTSQCVDADHFFVENDTLARIGTSCLQQLLESNVKKLSVARWERVATTFVKLFRTTTPHQLFDENLRIEIDSGTPEPQETNGRSLLFVLGFTFLTLWQMGMVRRLSLHPCLRRSMTAKGHLLSRH
jgi:brefeldin A-inhibited guanine nucleotide-exchange protein